MTVLIVLATNSNRKSPRLGDKGLNRKRHRGFEKSTLEFEESCAWSALTLRLVTACAICDSDLHIYNGVIPQVEKGDVIGHETMGEVVEVGSATAS